MLVPVTGHHLLLDTAKACAFALISLNISWEKMLVWLVRWQEPIICNMCTETSVLHFHCWS
jgi:hypothetical protein